MKLKIEIDLDNAAFEPEQGTEAAHILRDLAKKIDGVAWEVESDPYDTRIMLRDSNGNTVGKAVVE